MEERSEYDAGPYFKPQKQRYHELHDQYQRGGNRRDNSEERRMEKRRGKVALQQRVQIYRGARGDRGHESCALSVFRRFWHFAMVTACARRRRSSGILRGPI